MTTVYTGSVLGISAMSAEERDKARKELAWLENDLIRRRKRLAYWSRRKHQAETLPDIPEDLREGAFYFYMRAQELVNSGERLRAYLVIELQEQPDHLPAYHHAH